MLEEALLAAAAWITEQDTKNWFDHRAYHGQQLRNRSNAPKLTRQPAKVELMASRMVSRLFLLVVS